MLASAIERCAGDPHCRAAAPGSPVTGLDGSFAGVQTTMVAVAGALVVLAIVGMILWLWRTQHASPALFAVAPDAAPAPATQLGSAAALLVRLDEDRADGLVGEDEYLERRAAILSGA